MRSRLARLGDFCEHNMKDVFISCEQVDLPHAVTLIERLRQKGFNVSHSPRNLLDGGKDERWRGWYSGGGQAEIGKAEIFVVVVTAGWDGATWMAFEAEEARKGLQQGCIKRMFHYNPIGIKIHYPENKQHWLGEKLPDELERAVATLEAVI